MNVLLCSQTEHRANAVILRERVGVRGVLLKVIHRLTVGIRVRPRTIALGVNGPPNQWNNYSRSRDFLGNGNGNGKQINYKKKRSEWLQNFNQNKQIFSISQIKDQNKVNGLQHSREEPPALHPAGHSGYGPERLTLAGHIHHPLQLFEQWQYSWAKGQYSRRLVLGPCLCLMVPETIMVPHGIQRGCYTIVRQNLSEPHKYNIWWVLQKHY